MKIETRSTINTPIIEDDSIVLLNPEGDLIIDAPIVSRRGNITLIAKNIYITGRSGLITEAVGSKSKGNILFQSSGHIYVETGIKATQNLTMESENITLKGLQNRKNTYVRNIQTFDRTRLRHVDRTLINRTSATTTEAANPTPAATRPSNTPAINRNNNLTLFRLPSGTVPIFSTNSSSIRPR